MEKIILGGHTFGELLEKLLLMRLWKQHQNLDLKRHITHYFSITTWSPLKHWNVKEGVSCSEVGLERIRTHNDS